MRETNGTEISNKYNKYTEQTEDKISTMNAGTR